MSRAPLSVRTLLAAVALPAAIVCADQLAMSSANGHRWTELPTLCLFAWFMLQNGLLCYGAVRWLPN